MQQDILIFRTSIRRKQEIKSIEKILSEFPQVSRWNIDFEDWEKVLRIESKGIKAIDISKALRTVNIFASELE